jgi:hypothetical protein
MRSTTLLRIASTHDSVFADRRMRRAYAVLIEHRI